MGDIKSRGEVANGINAFWDMKFFYKFFNFVDIGFSLHLKCINFGFHMI